MEYWERDMYYKKRSFLLSLFGFISIIFSISFNSYQIYLNGEQSARLEKSTRANVQNSILNHLFRIDEIFVQKPYLKPYFYENKPTFIEDDNYQEVQATALMVLDMFDIAILQRTTFSEYWDSPRSVG